MNQSERSSKCHSYIKSIQVRYSYVVVTPVFQVNVGRVVSYVLTKGWRGKERGREVVKRPCRDIFTEALLRVLFLYINRLAKIPSKKVIS